jgi:hypothetical protein
MYAANVTSLRRDWIDEARTIPTETVLHERGILKTLTGRGSKFVGPCPRCGTGVDRFAVHLGKGNGGAFYCRVCDLGGKDAISLVMFLDHCKFYRAVEILTGRPPPGRKAESNEERIAREHRASALRIQMLQRQRERQQREAEEQQRQHDKAYWLWARREPISGTIAEKYLREVRGITCSLPSTLAFLPPRKPAHHPALIACFAIPKEHPNGTLDQPRAAQAVQLTLLRSDGNGKADVPNPKISVGSHDGLPIVLAAATDLLSIAICEGIEDALSVHEAAGIGAWAAGGAHFMPALAAAVPERIESVTVFADDNDTGRTNAHKLAVALRERSVEVLVVGG